MSAQSDPQFLERDEFYLALRLIALSQNNLEVSEEVIRINHPIPPLPKIDLKSGITNIQNSTLDNSINLSNSVNSNFSANNQIPIHQPEKDLFSISEEDENKYSTLFNKNKDLTDKMSIKKLNEMFISAKIQQNILTKIFSIVNLSDPNEINLSEFKVVFKLIYKSYEINEVPNILPNSLKFVLMHGEARQKAKDINFIQSSITNSNPITIPNHIPNSIMRNSTQIIPQNQQNSNPHFQSQYQTQNLNQNQQGKKYNISYLLNL